MAKQKDQRAYIRVSDDDKHMVQELAEKLNVSESTVWRIAIKKLHEETVKPSK
jgi:predicted transcriptional regulator